MYKVFIDGREGTTGLGIQARLEKRSDIELIILPEALRKNNAARKDALNSCDVAFLCLPDAAAIEAADMVENESVKIIDASTAHRTSPGWTYGFAELSDKHRADIAASKRVANPGCHASGFISLIYPLVSAGILPQDARLSCTSLTGYSGGGKKMIAAYEAADKDALLCAPRHYGLGQTHKHLKEMAAVCSLEHAPVFMPIVDDFYSGMAVAVPMSADMLTPGRTIEDVKAAYERLYKGLLVRYVPDADEGGYLSAAALSGSDRMEISVFGNEERFTLVSRFDNLGKGASGAATENMNIMLGIDSYTGLVV